MENPDFLIEGYELDVQTFTTPKERKSNKHAQLARECISVKCFGLKCSILTLSPAVFVPQVFLQEVPRSSDVAAACLGASDRKL